MNFDYILGKWKEYRKKDKIKIANLQKLNDIMAAYKILNSIINTQHKDTSIGSSNCSMECSCTTG